jgi:hypothetical protein
MWDEILDSLYVGLSRENEIRAEQGLKPLNFKQYIEALNK